MPLALALTLPILPTLPLSLFRPLPLPASPSDTLACRLVLDHRARL